MITLTTYMVLSGSFRTNEYSLASLNNFCNAFYPPDCVGSDGGCRDSTTYDDDRFCHLARKNQTYDAISYAVDNYYHMLGNKSLAGYELLYTDNAANDYDFVPSPSSTPYPITLLSSNYEEGTSHLIKEKSYDLTPGDLGPVDITLRSGVEIKEFYSSLQKFKLVMQVKDTLPTSYATTLLNNDCYLWNVTVHYIDENAANLKVYVIAELVSRCDGSSNARLSTSNGVLFLVMIITSVIFSIFVVLDLWKELKIFMYCRKAYKIKSHNFLSSLPSSLKQKLEKDDTLPLMFWIRFFDGWGMGMLLATACTIAWSLGRLLGYEHVPIHTTYFLSGLSCGLYWATLMTHLHNYSKLYAIILILRRAVPQVIRILIGAFPIFIAFGLLGMTLFGPSSSRFATLQMSLTTLFSLMNGDIILEVLGIVRLNFPTFGPIYVVMFFFVFTYFFLHMMLTVVEESLWLVNAEGMSMSDTVNAGPQTTRRSFGSKSPSRQSLSRNASRLSATRLSASISNPNTFSPSNSNSKETLSEPASFSGGEEEFEVEEIFAGLLAVRDAHESADAKLEGRRKEKRLEDGGGEKEETDLTRITETSTNESLTSQKVEKTDKTARRSKSPSSLPLHSGPNNIHRKILLACSVAGCSYVILLILGYFVSKDKDVI